MKNQLIHHKTVQFQTGSLRGPLSSNLDYINVTWRVWDIVSATTEKIQHVTSMLLTILICFFALITCIQTH